MCSSTLGPATVPSLVTWPTMRIDTPNPLASCSRTLVDSRTWDTAPGAADTDSLYMVWMESMTTASGLRLRTLPFTLERVRAALEKEEA